MKRGWTLLTILFTLFSMTIGYMQITNTTSVEDLVRGYFPIITTAVQFPTTTTAVDMVRKYKKEKSGKSGSSSGGGGSVSGDTPAPDAPTPPAPDTSFVNTCVAILATYKAKGITYAETRGGIYDFTGTSDCSHFVYDCVRTHYGEVGSYKQSRDLVGSCYPGFVKVTSGPLSGLAASGVLEPGDICATNGHTMIVYSKGTSSLDTYYCDFGVTIYNPKLRRTDTKNYTIWRHG